MAVVAKYTCDGCRTEKEVQLGETPSDWDNVNIAVSGVPAHVCYNGSRRFQLCGYCRHRVARWIKAEGWRDVKLDWETEEASGEEAQ